MSIHTHDAPQVEQAFEAAAPTLTDWAVVAKVIRLDAIRATRVGEYIVNKLAANNQESSERLLYVDRDNDSSVTTFTYSLPDYRGHEDSAVKARVFDGISLTKEGIDAVASAGLIVSLRLTHWKDLAVQSASGATAFDTSWDKFPSRHDAFVESMLEANGHGLPGISH